MKSENDKVPEWHKIACAMLDAESRYPDTDVNCLPFDLETALEETDRRIQFIKPDGGLKSTQAISSIIQQWRQWHEHGQSEHDWEW